jgi:hypothetical protein
VPGNKERVAETCPLSLSPWSRLFQLNLHTYPNILLFILIVTDIDDLTYMKQTALSLKQNELLENLIVNYGQIVTSDQIFQVLLCQREARGDEEGQHGLFPAQRSPWQHHPDHYQQRVLLRRAALLSLGRYALC